MLKMRSKRSAEVSQKPHSRLSLVTTLFNRRWWWFTLLVLVAMGVMVRLGFWQLDRLVQRRAHNTLVAQQLAAPPLALTGQDLGANIAELKYRPAIVRGEYDHSQEVVLKNQAWLGQPGLHLITPLLIEGSDQAVLVDRGWISYEELDSKSWEKFTESGPVEIKGMIRMTQTKLDSILASDVTPSPPGEQQTAWFRLDIAAIQGQTPYKLLPIYIRQSPDPAWTKLPYRGKPNLDLSEGSHLGYALQWFSFTLILGGGYIHLVRKNSTKISEEIK